MPRPVKLEDWMLDAVQLMARTGCGLRQATLDLGIEISSEECAAVIRRANFQRLLWEARHRYFADLAKDPNFDQDVIVGKMMDLAEKLDQEGHFDKAAEVLLKLSKIKGWVGPESQVSVFGELSQRDLDTIRQNLEKNVGRIQ